MANVEEVLAKADAWEKAGKPENAAKLRAYADTLKPKHDAASVMSKADEWEKAGQADKAAKLREYAKTLPQAPQGALPKAEPATYAAPPPAETEAERAQRVFEQFEAANPLLAGKYKPGAQPAVGDVVMAGGGGGKSGGARYTVKSSPTKDSFGETALAMTEGPMEAAKAFGSGLVGGDSPSREYLANDPLSGALPGPVLTGLGAVGDAGGAALSLVGAGISGLAGLGAELMPGQDSADEKKLAGDLTGMTMFAVPELAGGSSVSARMASGVSLPAKAATVLPRSATAEAVAAADRFGIPVMRTDVKPPTTFAGKVIQKTGESIPIAGTGGMRADQAAKRVEAVKSFIREYWADNVAPAIDDVTTDFLAKRDADLGKYTAQKKAVIESAQGTVPVPKALAAIDEQIAKLTAAKNEAFGPVIKELQDFKKAITGQKLTEVEMNRAYMGKVFSGLDAAKIKDAGEKAFTAVYRPLVDDMGTFIKATKGLDAFRNWASANEKLSELAGELGNSALKNALKKGELTPEVTERLLLSSKPSDVRLLYKSLNEKGRAAARAAIVQKAVAAAGGLDDISPERFRSALAKLGSQVGVFFKGEDLEAATGLIKAIKLTQRGSVAGAAPLTGVQNLPAIITLATSHFVGGSVPGTLAALGTIGGLARLYEATGVKRAMRQMEKARTPRAEKAALQNLEKALLEAGVSPAGQAANQPDTPNPARVVGR